MARWAALNKAQSSANGEHHQADGFTRAQIPSPACRQREGEGGPWGRGHCVDQETARRRRFRRRGARCEVRGVRTEQEKETQTQRREASSSEPGPSGKSQREEERQGVRERREPVAWEDALVRERGSAAREWPESAHHHQGQEEQAQPPPKGTVGELKRKPTCSKQ